MDSQAQANILLTVCCVAPWLIGFVIGWGARGAIDRHGWIGLLPQFIREWLET